jgi:hypothetical protein
MAVISPYATALALARPRPTWVEDGPYNSDRITAYGTYEDIWNNIADAFAALLRIDDDPKARRFIPAVRGVIESVNRYLAKDPEISWTPIPGATVSQEDLDQFSFAVQALMTREEFDIKFLAMKRWWLIKGDALLMLSADPTKDQGQRIRINEVPAEQFFPIYDAADGERVIGCYLASIVLDDEDKEIVQRIEYQKISTLDRSAVFNGAPLGSVFYRMGFYEQDGWDDRDGEDLKPLGPPSWGAPAEGVPDFLAGYALPTQITTIPVYHFRNNRRGGIAGRYGASEIQGLETLLAGAIQNASDEDQAIALLGIGTYWTTSGRPRDANGRETDWLLSPGSVLELEPDGTFGKVDGISSVQPMQDHLNYLAKAGREAASVPDIAAGTTDPASTASGVALSIQFLPILTRNMEKEAELNSKLTHMLYDLAYMWFPAYEATEPPQVQPGVTFGSPLPVDRAATLNEIVLMVTNRIISIAYAQQLVQEKLGYQIPAGMLATIVSEQEQLLDATGQRLATDDPNGDGSFGAGQGTQPNV